MIVNNFEYLLLNALTHLILPYEVAIEAQRFYITHAKL